MIETLYTRYVHGSYPVKVVTQEDQETFELGLPEGIQRFLTARDLIQAIYDYTGDIAPRRISFRSYFRLAKVSDPEMTVLKLLELPEPRQRKLGIDLAKRGGKSVSCSLRGLVEGWRHLVTILKRSCKKFIGDSLRGTKGFVLGIKKNPLLVTTSTW